jgi:hypothetical protein
MRESGRKSRYFLVSSSDLNDKTGLRSLSLLSKHLKVRTAPTIREIPIHEYSKL